MGLSNGVKLAILPLMHHRSRISQPVTDHSPEKLAIYSCSYHRFPLGLWTDWCKCWKMRASHSNWVQKRSEWQSGVVSTSWLCNCIPQPGFWEGNKVCSPADAQGQLGNKACCLLCIASKPQLGANLWGSSQACGNLSHCLFRVNSLHCTDMKIMWIGLVK